MLAKSPTGEAPQATTAIPDNGGHGTAGRPDHLPVWGRSQMHRRGLGKPLSSSFPIFIPYIRRPRYRGLRLLLLRVGASIRSELPRRCLFIISAPLAWLFSCLSLHTSFLLFRNVGSKNTGAVVCIVMGLGRCKRKLGKRWLVGFRALGFFVFFYIA